ncbi:anoctamin-5-like isoform X2 [Ischnura elegans]|uniref:anoctamin-5-like isoform X2 n=1 Tax=Ischnura elegans TaxID=197161 RepID=UPI001ED8A378|nr:anoctamin-5-like isoform X2 [Ischnura elegans]
MRPSKQQEFAFWRRIWTAVKQADARKRIVLRPRPEASVDSGGYRSHWGSGAFRLSERPLVPCEDTHEDPSAVSLLDMNQTAPGEFQNGVAGEEGGTMRRVDFVLTYHDHNHDHHESSDSMKKRRRKIFEENLEAEGLELERQPSIHSTSIPSFLKISVPYEVMCVYAEILEFRKPLKPHLMEKESSHVPLGSHSQQSVRKRRGGNLTLRRTHAPTHIPNFKTEFRVNLEQIFDIPADRESFFTSAERAQVVWYILRRSTFGEKDSEPTQSPWAQRSIRMLSEAFVTYRQQVGIFSLLANGTYHDAYPLHDGDYKPEPAGGLSSDLPPGMRCRLKREWARPGAWRKAQPLDEIREYFGDEVALYFAWLGLYTKSLIPAAAIGVACFFFGLIQLATPDKEPVEEVCYGSMGNEMLCARCTDGSCSEEQLRASCGTRILLLLFDHPATVAFSVFMSFWATGFLEQWKRTQARLCLKWGGEALLSTGGSDRNTWETRPEYEASAKLKFDHETKKNKLYFPTWNKALRIFTAASVVFFMVTVVVAALIGVIMYKVAISSALYFTDDDYVKSNSKNLTSLTAAIINLIIILLLKLVYDRIAIWLTNLENPKTQSDYETSYTFKVFVFEFFNCYSSLFYIAFFKGRFYTYPGDQGMSNLHLAQDTCDSGGCLSELFIQLVVIMVGKQVLNGFMEVFMPRISNWWSSRKNRTASEVSNENRSRWEADFHLHRSDNLSLFQEMMEIVLQYGFVTLFVAAFPLAPLCALINNAAEIRLDADKLVTQYRRPLPRRTNTIGPWFTIQQTITYLAVAVNAFIIAFTSEFIPRLIYIMTVSENRSLAGYVNFTLSVYAKSDSSGWNMSTGETCRYKGFREPPDSDHPYALTATHWHVLTAQLAFVIVFEHLVLGLSGLLAYCIPDVPRSVREQAHEEREKARAIRRPPRPNSPV